MKINILKKSSYSIFIGILLGILVLNIFLINTDKKIDFENFALNQTDKASKASFDNEKIHCSDLKDLELCLKGYKKKNDIPVVLWLGNSQLHVINQYESGDETAAIKIHKLLKEFGFYTLTFSQANANLQEHLLLFTHLLNYFPVKTLILPIVFDDLREDKIRVGIKEILKDTVSYNKIKETLTGRKLIEMFEDLDFSNQNINFSEEDQKNHFENLIDEKLGNLWKLWDERENLRGQLFGKLYLLRNSIFRIDATTTRKMIKNSYENNINAFKDILKIAKIYKINVLVYIPPIRNDIKIPYEIEEYDKFKKNIKDISYEQDAYFTSLENLVPPEFWGLKGSTNLGKLEEVDFMHFQSHGHSLLAEEIFSKVIKILQLH